MGFTKPSVQVDWINDDSATKYTIPSAGDQLAGHLSGTNADPKIFNWLWWRVSQWIEFLDNTFDSNGNEVNAPNSTKITETVSPTISTVTLDAGGIKSWDGSSNAIFSVTEAGVVTLGYSGNDIISLNAGVISVCTATSADLVKLHGITASYSELNQLTGVTVGGSASGDIVTIGGVQSLTNKTLTAPKLNEAVNLTSTSTELNQLDGVSVGGSSAGDIVTIDDTQTLTNKTISFSQIYSGTAAAGRTFTITGHDTTPANFAFQGSSRYTRVSCDAAGTEMSILPSATNTVALAIGSSTYRYSSIGIYGSASGITIDTSGTVNINGSSILFNSASLADALLGDGTAGRIVRVIRVGILAGSVSGIKCTGYDIWNGDAIATGDDIDKGDAVGYWTLDGTYGNTLTINASGITGNCVAVLASHISYNSIGKDVNIQCDASSNNIVLVFSEAPSSGTIDLTTEITGTEALSVYITYLTDA